MPTDFRPFIAVSLLLPLALLNIRAGIIPAPSKRKQPFQRKICEIEIWPQEVIDFTHAASRFYEVSRRGLRS
jgi:hypothetical protein